MVLLEPEDIPSLLLDEPEVDLDEVLLDFKASEAPEEDLPAVERLVPLLRLTADLEAVDLAWVALGRLAALAELFTCFDLLPDEERVAT